jgi:O-antigen/teichoic acid export membrane protein
VLVLLIAQAIATRGDRLVIGAIAGSSELGQYAVAVSVMELLSVGALALANVTFQGLASGTLPHEAMVRARRGTLIATATAAGALIIVSPWLIGVAFGSQFDEAVSPLRILAIAAVPYSMYQIDTQHLIARAQAPTAASLASWSAGAMVIGDLILVPIWGIIGAAWLSVAVFAASAILARRVVTRHELTRSGPLGSGARNVHDG